MRPIQIVALAVCLAPAIAAAQPLALDSADARAVAQLMAAFDETGSGRGAEVGKKRASLFSDNAVFVNAFGVRREGKDSIGAFWMLVYTSGSFATSTIERLDRQQRVIGPGLVLVDHVERITGQRNPETGREMPPRTAHLTLLLQRQAPGDWRIVYYRAGDVRT